MELSKNDSKMLQGLSVLAMVWLHLFDRDFQGLFTPIIFVGGIPFSFYIAQLSDYCVFGFAFLSGYAHMLQSKNGGYYRRRLKGLLSLLCSYWIIMIVFSFVSFIVGQGDYMPGNFREFAMNALTLESSYNGAWWYMFTYVVLVVASPLILTWVKKNNLFIVIVTGFVIYCVSYYVRFKLLYSNWLLSKFGPLGMTFFEYLLGAVAYKYEVLSFLYQIWKKLTKLTRLILSSVLIAGLLYARTKIIPSLFVAPITGFIALVLFHFWEKPEIVKKMMMLIGSHSTNIWLTHMFFCLCLFENLVYIAKYPLIIFLLMIIITLSFSVVLKWMEKPIQEGIAKL